MSIPKLHPKHMVWMMPLVLSCLMSGAISLINILINKGWFEGIFIFWLKSWGISWLFAFPLVLMILPLVRKIVTMFIDTP